MKRIIFNRYFVFVFTVLSLVIFFTPTLLEQSVSKSISILISILLWVGLIIYTKNLVKSSILYTLIILPFNLTIQLPYSVEIFNTNILLSNPYVDGIFVNYLVPTISIIDFGFILIFFSILVEKGFKIFKKILGDIKNGLLILILFLFIQNIFLNDFLSVFSSFRVVLYILSFVLIVCLLKGGYLNGLQFPILLILLINVLVQIFVGIMQFVRGSSLGLLFLGESQVVSGMQGSSFVDLSGELFLRAYGTFPHPNVLGGFLILCLILGVFSIRRFRLLGILLSLFSFVLIFFTFSRLYIFLGILFLFVYFFRFFIRKKGFIFSFSPILLIERFVNLFGGGDSSWMDRVNLFKVSLIVIKNNFIFGSGIGGFVRGMELFVPRTSKGILLLEPVHNVFMLVLSELGFVGFLIFFYVILMSFILNVGRLGFFRCFVLFILLIICMFDHYMFSLPQGMVLFYMFMLVIYKKNG